MFPAAQLARDAPDHLSLESLFDSDDWWVEQKIDGQRFMVSVNNGELHAYNRKSKELMVPPKVAADFHDGTFDKNIWWFDGELLDGKYYIFDCLHAGQKSLLSASLEDRHDVLERIFSLWNPSQCFMVRAAKTPETKAGLTKLLQETQSEGIVLKNKKSPYRPGKRVSHMLKVKFVSECDVVVMELCRGGKPQSVTIGMYSHGQLIEVAGCKVSAGLELHVGDVMEVRYLYATADNKLTQPIYKRVRDDKLPTDCTFDQMQYTSRVIQ